MKKVFYILIFFIVAGGIFYVAENLNPKNGVTIEEIVQLVNGKTEIDNADIEKKLEEVKNENMLDENSFSPFVSIGKSLQGRAKEIYQNIIISNYSKDSLKFIKLASSLRPEDISRLFKILTDNDVNKSNIIENIQKTIKGNNMTKEQVDKLNQLISNIK